MCLGCCASRRSHFQLKLFNNEKTVKKKKRAESSQIYNNHQAAPGDWGGVGSCFRLLWYYRSVASHLFVCSRTKHPSHPHHKIFGSTKRSRMSENQSNEASLTRAERWMELRRRPRRLCVTVVSHVAMWGGAAGCAMPNDPHHITTNDALLPAPTPPLHSPPRGRRFIAPDKQSVHRKNSAEHNSWETARLLHLRSLTTLWENRIKKKNAAEGRRGSESHTMRPVSSPWLSPHTILTKLCSYDQILTNKQVEETHMERVMDCEIRGRCRCILQMGFNSPCSSRQWAYYTHLLNRDRNNMS